MLNVGIYFALDCLHFDIEVWEMRILLSHYDFPVFLTKKFNFETTSQCSMVQFSLIMSSHEVCFGLFYFYVPLGLYVGTMWWHQIVNI